MWETEPAVQVQGPVVTTAPGEHPTAQQDVSATEPAGSSPPETQPTVSDGGTAASTQPPPATQPGQSGDVPGSTDQSPSSN